MDSTLYDQLLPHRGLFHPGTLACGVTVGPSSSPSKRSINVANRQTPIYDTSLSDAGYSPKWRRLTADDRCRPGGGDVTLGLMTSPDVDDFLFHTPPPSDVSSDDASSALPFSACDDDDNVLVGLFDNGVATPTTNDSEILFAGAVTAEQEAYARGFVDALEELRRKDEPQPHRQQQLLINDSTACFTFDSASSFSSSASTHMTSGYALKSTENMINQSLATGAAWPTSGCVDSQQSLWSRTCGDNHRNENTKLLACPCPSSLNERVQTPLAHHITSRPTAQAVINSHRHHAPSGTSETVGSTVDDFRSVVFHGQRPISPPLGCDRPMTVAVASFRSPCTSIGGPQLGQTTLAASYTSYSLPAPSRTDERAQTVPRLGNTPPLSSKSSSVGSVFGVPGKASNSRNTPYCDATADDDLELDDDDDDLDRSSMTPNELARADRKRERNRLAARKCRSRKLEQIATLEARCAVLRAQNETLAKSASGLADDVARLKGRLQLHVSGPDCRIGLHQQGSRIGSYQPEVVQADITHHSVSSKSSV